MAINYRDEILHNYFLDDKCPHLAVSRADQEAFHDDLSGLLPTDRNAAILDIGCGSGRLLYYLNSRGYKNIEGIDVGDKQVELVRRMNIRATKITDISSFLAGRSYDMIIMIGTIEHLPKASAWGDLKAVYAALKPGGHFLFETPNMASFSATYRRYIDYTHEIGFSERSAAQMMNVLGYKSICVTGDYIRPKLRFNRLLFYLANLSFRLLMRLAYIAENGTDAPKIVSKNLIVRGTK